MDCHPICDNSFLCRAPWRLATYYAHSKDRRILPLLQAQKQFFEGQKLISAGYKLDGTPLATYSNIAFLAPVWCLFKVSLYLFVTCALCKKPCVQVATQMRIAIISMSVTLSGLQVMGSNASKVSEVEVWIEDMRGWGHGTYYGESVEALAGLQLQYT